MSDDINDQLVLIVGKSAAGKSAALRNLENPEGVMYLNTESNKRLPFPAKFKQYTIVDPMQIEEAFQAADKMPEVHTIVVDSLTYMMDLYESLYVLPAANTMKAWGDFAQFFKRIMQQHVAKSTKRVIFLAHVSDVTNDDAITETCVPVKGSLKNNGIESYFSTVIAAKKVAIKDLKDYANPLLTITPEEEGLKFKYVFQTRLTARTVNERLRGPMAMWSNAETFIDNDIQLVLNRFDEYYI
jgi:hypothetical protein